MMSGVGGVAWAAVWVVVVLVVVCCRPSHAQTSEPCEDSDSQCPELARQGACQDNPRDMLANCRRSCNTCGTELADFPTIVDPEFDCGRPYVKSSGVNPSSSSSSRRRRHARPGPQSQATVTREESPTAPRPGPSPLVTVADAFCGVTPISDRFLLTSAYCVLNPEKPVYSVRLGELDFSRENEPNSRPRDYDVKQIIVHPDFQANSTGRYYDLALIETVEKIAFDEVVFPYCLPAVRPPPGTTVTGAGFGYVNATHKSPILQEVDLKVLMTSECETQYKANPQQFQRLQENYPNQLQGSDLMCAGYPGKGPCKDDEGGPLYGDGEGRRYLLGILSFTGPCDTSNIMPGVYMSVADHIDFIDRVVYGF